MTDNIELVVKLSSGGAGQPIKDVVDLQGAIRQLGKDARDTQKLAQSLGKAFDLPDDQIDDLVKAIGQARQETETWRDATGRLRVANGRFIKEGADGFDNVGNAAKGATGNVTALGIAIQDKLVELGLEALRRLATAISDTLGAALAEAAQFEEGSAAAATLVDDVDGLTDALAEQQDRLRGQVSTNELLAASYDVLSAGFTEAGEAAEITGESARGAIAGFSDVGTVTDAVTTIINSYSDANLTAAEVVDQLVQTQNLGKITVDQYAASIGRAASIASTAGVGFEELNAAVAAATAAGVAPESAVSGVRQAIMNLIKPTADAKAQLDEFGIANAQATLKSEGLVGVLRRLAEQDPTGEALSTIFTDVDALAAIAPIAGQNIDKLNASLEGIGNASGVTDQNLEKLTQTIPALQKAVQTLLIEGLLEFGQALSPITAGVLEFGQAVLKATAEGFDGFDQLIASGQLLRAELENNPEIAERLGEAIATLANEGVEQLRLLIDAISALASNEEAVEGIAIAIEDLAGVLQLLGQGARFAIALAEGLAQLNRSTKFVNALVAPILTLSDAFNTLVQQLGLVEVAIETFEGIDRSVADVKKSSDQMTAALAGAEVALQKANQAAEDTGKGTEQAAEDIENGVDTINAKYQQLADEADLATQQLIASRLEQGASAEEITGIEAKALDDRIALNRQKLAELQAINQDSLSPEDAEKLGDQIVATETAIATDRIQIAKEQAAERQRLAEEAAKAEADALKDVQEEQKRLAEQDFGDGAEQRQREFDDAAEDRAITTENRINDLKEQGQDRVEALKLQSQKSLQADAEAFQKRQQADARAFQKALDAERDAESSRIDAAASEAEFQTALRLAGSDEERQQLEDEREFAQKRAKVLAEEQAKALRTTNEGDELTPVEQARLALEERVAAKQQAFQDAQQAEAAAFEAQQQEQRRADEQAISDLEKENAEAIAQVKRDAADEERQRERDFEDAQQQLERDFKEEQRRLDKQNAEEIARILEGARPAGLDGARRDGGPVRGGGTYLVGEDGPELITPSRSGYVHTARETAAMMAQTRSPVHINAPQGTGTSMHGVEARLDKLTKLVEANRPVQAPATYIFEGDQAPTQTAVDMELRRISGLVKSSGL